MTTRTIGIDGMFSYLTVVVDGLKSHGTQAGLCHGVLSKVKGNLIGLYGKCDYALQAIVFPSALGRTTQSGPEI